MSKWTSSTTHHVRRFQPKRTADLNSADLFTYCSTGQQISSTSFRIWHFLTWKSLTAILNWCIGGLGLRPNDFSKRKASDCIYQSRKSDEKIYFWYFQGLKVVPQGPFGQTKLYFEPEKSPVGAFWADTIALWARKASRRGLLGKIFDKLRIQGRMQIFETNPRVL